MTDPPTVSGLGGVLTRAVKRLDAAARFTGPDVTCSYVVNTTTCDGRRWRVTVERL